MFVGAYTLLPCKSNIITYSGYVYVAVGIKHAMRMRHIIICGLPRSHNIFFPHYLTNGKIFGKKKGYRTKNVSFDFLYIFRLNISHSTKNTARYKASYKVILKFTLKCYTVARTCFGLVWPSSGSFSLNLAKVKLFCISNFTDEKP
jgi:hypothetical protein